MLLKLCKSCQYCLETMYWNCCEEKFCFDKKIASFKLDEDHAYTNGHANMGASLDSVVTEQPINNNHLPLRAISGRELNELPVHIDKLYEVFSKSLIFRDDHELKAKSSVDSLDEYETKSEPDYLSDKPNRSKVYFEDEINSPVTDFEIMFKDELLTGYDKDELLSGYDIFKIEEEEESDKASQDTEEGLTMNVSVKKQDVIKTSTVTIKDDSKITTINPIYKYDPISVVALPSTLSLPRVESVKGILRSNSAKTLERVDSGNRISRPQISRVESLKNIDPTKINRVLSRVPHRSASFLNIPAHLTPAKPPLVKSKSMVGVLSATEELKLSSLPDTPIIKSNNLPRFFADSPSIPEYRGDVSLQSIKQKSAMMFQENDFSMPRYYGTVTKATDPNPVHESKSMPDLRNPNSSGKSSKRLVKLRSRLKPLVIRKSSEEKL
ncbi:uncharacterized protein LOC113509357 isoform X1 [Galleria mellonella]|uniref:Uncharacterized protein LOC113509357 isoform X1 n=1 Tax=Galleria mellonella TaxID=7137 RepID=A0ABM3MW18_GALME|nr:uncharacterized protein LOC113509357 isoform X1 [Galleria mellonella]XP_052755430.1 uncharacterized protein LOC113509357 isoform X1 [Galleria mellonella]XP_052755431.1 uncharacterized protein LOC113509357 isoform X1 [Galleria mellonella]